MGVEKRRMEGLTAKESAWREGAGQGGVVASGATCG